VANVALAKQHRALIRQSVSLLQQQTVDPMRVDHLFAGRPCEDSETAVLRCYQSERIALIVYELCGGQVARAAFLCGMDHDRTVSDNWFGGNHLLNG
jgi:hypothetical protein